MTEPDHSAEFAKLVSFATAVLWLTGLVSLSVASLGVMRFVATPRPFYGLLSVVGMIGVWALWAIHRRAGLESRIGLSVSLLAIGITLCGAESVSLFLDAGQTARFPPTGPGMDSRSMQEVVTGYRESGQETVPLIAPSEFLNWGGHEDFAFFPVSGVSRAHTVFCNEAGEWRTYKSDEYGYDNPEGLWSDPSVVLVGDSFTHGMCVGPEETIAGQLRKITPKTVSLGYAGSGPLLILAALREYAERLKPEVVVWVHYGGNDLDNLFVEGKNPALLRYLDSRFRQELSTRQPEVDSTLQKWVDEEYSNQGLMGKELPSLGEIARFSRLSSLRSRLGLRPRPPYDLDLFERVLSTADQSIRSWDGRSIFVYLPSFEQLSGLEHPRGSPDEVLAIVEKLGWYVVDVRRLFEAEGADAKEYFTGPYHEAAHYSALGYGLVAAGLAQAIEVSAAP